MTAATRRAVVTGIGAIGPVGNDLDEIAEAVRTARSGIAPIEAFDTSPFRTRYGGEARGFDPAADLSEGEIDLFADRYLRLAVAAARRALAHAGLEWSSEAPPGPRAAIAVGTCNGGLATAERRYAALAGPAEGSFGKKENLLVRYCAAGKALARALHVTGPCWIVATACSSSTASIGLALELVASGAADAVLAGGADALCMTTMAGFDVLKSTSTDRIAPFSTPPGLNLGEGAAFWVVEEEGRARDRGARALGEVLSYAFTADAHHATAPEPRGEGAYRTMRIALERASVGVEEIGCVNAHGTGTEANDRAESRAIARLAAGRALPAFSFKSQIGHCLGAAGALEATAGLSAMRDGLIPATINFSKPRPGCDVDCVPNVPRRVGYDRFITCNYAFGGHNAAAVVGIHDPARPPAARHDPAARAVITGCGAVTPLGLGAGGLAAALREGRVGISPVSGRLSVTTLARRAGLVPEVDPRKVDRRLDLRGAGRISRHAVIAARLAMAHAGLRPGPREGLETGVINGVCVGPDEEAHMWAAIRSGGAEGDIGCFSSIVASAVAGWVSRALSLKGYSCTVAQGSDAGLLSLILARLAVGSGAARRVLAGAADGIFDQYFLNCDDAGLLCTGEEEERYRARLDVPDRRVLGEGAAYVLVEEESAALERGARPLALVAGWGQATDPRGFHEPSSDPDGLCRAADIALSAAGWDPRDVGLVVWSPQGNRNDRRCLAALESVLGGAGPVPAITCVFNTGHMEASSGVATLAAALAAWDEGGGLWPQRTGLAEIDGLEIPDRPVPTLILGASEIGLDAVLAIEPWDRGQP